MARPRQQSWLIRGRVPSTAVDARSNSISLLKRSQNIVLLTYVY